MNILNACVSFFLGRYRKRHWPTNKQPAIKVQTVTFILNELILQPVQCDKFCERFPNAKPDERQTNCTCMCCQTSCEHWLFLDVKIYRASDI